MVHSQVGDTCVGAKVNGKVMPLRQHLSNGDQVEVITARGGKPNPDWLKFVATGRARARIRRFAQAAERETHRQEGRAAVAKAFRQDGLDFSEKLLEPALKTLKQTSTEELFVAVGSGALGPREVLFAAVPELRAPARPVEPMMLSRPRGRLGGGPLVTARAEGRSEAAAEGPMAITGLPPGTPVQYAGCCNPVPGDAILGIINTGRAITIHRRDCHTLESFSATPERFFEVGWEAQQSGAHTAKLSLCAANEPNVLSGITNAIAKQDGAIASLRVTRRQDECDVALEAEVRDLRHLANIMAGLRACPGVIRVDRARS
jgi:GTP pyrophosphokinase